MPCCSLEKLPLALGKQIFSRREHKLPFCLLQRDLHNLLLYSLATFIFPLETSKGNRAKPRSY